MTGALGVRLVLLGALVLLSTGSTLLAVPRTPPTGVPLSCQRRVEVFAAHRRRTLLVSVAVAAAGAVLLLVDAS